MKNTEQFPVGSWVTWKDPEDAEKRGFKSYGEGPFEVVGIRGEFLDIRHYCGSPRGSWIGKVTGFVSNFFVRTDPPKGESMVFMKFTLADTSFGADYFVGTSVADILADTNNGKSFGGEAFTSSEQVSFEEVQALDLTFFRRAVEAVKGGCPSYYIGALRPSEVSVS